jgi:hypothetical protein
VAKHAKGHKTDPFFMAKSVVLIVIPFFSLVFWELFSLTAGAAIPIGIAVGRQRLQETTTTQSLPQLQSKDLNRFSLGLAELGKLKRMKIKIKNETKKK